MKLPRWMTTLISYIRPQQSTATTSVYCQHCNWDITERGGMVYLGSVYCYRSIEAERPSDEVPCSYIAITKVMLKQGDDPKILGNHAPEELQAAIKSKELTKYGDLELRALAETK